MKKILVATDGSKVALKAIDYAAEIAAHFSGAKITLITVAHPGTDAIVVEGGYGAMKSAQDAVELSEKQAREEMDRSAASLKNHGISFDTVIASGNPGAEICVLAGKGEYELIVIGNRNRNVLADILLGSVSAHVVNHAHCPVLVVK